MSSMDTSKQEQALTNQPENFEDSKSLKSNNENSDVVGVLREDVTTDLSLNESTEETTNRFLSSILDDSSSAIEPFSSHADSSTNSPVQAQSLSDLTDEFGNSANDLNSQLEESNINSSRSIDVAPEDNVSEEIKVQKHTEVDAIQEEEKSSKTSSNDEQPISETKSPVQDIPSQNDDIPQKENSPPSLNLVDVIDNSSVSTDTNSLQTVVHNEDFDGENSAVSNSQNANKSNEEVEKMDVCKTPPKSPEKSQSKESIEETTVSEKISSTPLSEENIMADSNNTEEEVNENGTNTTIEINENPIFVHVDTENEDKSDDGIKKGLGGSLEEDFSNNQPQEDPIGGDDCVVAMEEDEVEQSAEEDQGSDGVQTLTTGSEEDEEQGASEELCLIPDTEQIIVQDNEVIDRNINSLSDVSNSGSKISSKTVTEKYILSLHSHEDSFQCWECSMIRKPKYKIVTSITSKTHYVCNTDCIQKVMERVGDEIICNVEGDLCIKNLKRGLKKDTINSGIRILRKCRECSKKLSKEEYNLSWETMEFCNESCLMKFQRKTGSNCSNCKSNVRSPCLGKYCVRFGGEIKQFCSSTCLDELKKNLKCCFYCQKVISSADGFLAPTGTKGQFRDFCSQKCVEAYKLTKPNKLPKESAICVVCLIEKPVAIEYTHEGTVQKFCGEHCFVAFKFVKNIVTGKCKMCQKNVSNKILEENQIYHDGSQINFCSKICSNIYVMSERKIICCSWCRVKKYNFDMIKKNNGPSLCSINCLNLYHVSLNAANMKRINCDQCGKNTQPLYHLTMSDATLRNFCSHSCVMSYQGKYSTAPITLNEDSFPVPTSGPKKTKKLYVTKKGNLGSPTESPTIPVISNVQSLAMTNGPSSGTRNNKTKCVGESVLKPPQVKTIIKQQIIIKAPPVPCQRNVATMCKVINATKGINAKPTMCDQEVQTDKIPDKKALIPIPVPIYVPSPAWMYSMPFPVPFPFPLPIPVPIFIPTTKNSANSIMKEIKKIQVKIPTDPFEAELLMMAEMVAGDKKEDNSESDSDEEDTTGAVTADASSYTSEPADTSNTFGEEMLQMALKMATELEEPAVDLEGALTANTITAPQNDSSSANEEIVPEPQPISTLIERQPIRGRKRPGRPPKSGIPSKRGRRPANHADISLMAPPPPPPPPQEPIEKPDANMCLKFTFGVNAWKQWVTTKNMELEKSSRRMKLFKPEILQLTSDELNYSLCLFVKEVRKPNGQEYAPDTIYYLCLGIQQYLFENGRIDNIFCDAYYEKFTDHLDEVARKFSILYNDSHFIVTRVEEEHLWESKQLGAHSPHVLLSTLMFFNTKHFNLTTVEEHMQLSFSHIMKHWKRNPNQSGANKVAGSRNVLLRFYPPQNINESTPRKKKVYEQQENEDNPLRCPVKLYEFYLSKCPESVKTRNDVFYLLPERSCVPDSPVWYSTMPLPKNALEKMLHRVKMVKEINVALLTS